MQLHENLIMLYTMVKTKVSILFVLDDIIALRFLFFLLFEFVDIFHRV